MSRATISLVLLLVLIVGGLFLLSGRDTEKPPVRVEKALLNEAAPQ